jgi:AcrR family transcriptional regulator
MDTDNRPLRADAERNRKAIICAAGEIFASEGTTVTLEYIAERAGVGVGTIYRRFPSIEALISVVFEEKIRHFADDTEAAAEQALTEPWEAFAGYVRRVAELQATDLAFSEVILSPGLGSELFRKETQRALSAMRRLVRQATEAGVLRVDFHESDLLMLQYANAGLVRSAQRSAPTAWKRLTEYMLQAFRAPGGPLEPPSVTWVRLSGHSTVKADL